VKKKIILLVFLAVLQKLYSADIQVTGTDAGFYFTPEYNRAYNFCWDISAVGSVTLNDRHVINGGLALGAAGDTFDIKLFAGAETVFYTRIPIYVNLSYRYNGLPEYESHTHSIPLLVSLKWQRIGFYLGPSFRFSSFFGDEPVFESMVSLLVYVILFDDEHLRIGLKAANFDDFSIDNFGAYFLNLNSVVRLNEKLSIVNEIEMRQSGSVALTSNFYGFIYRGGVKLKW